jgi:hypothetical protein
VDKHGQLLAVDFLGDDLSVCIGLERHVVVSLGIRPLVRWPSGQKRLTPHPRFGHEKAASTCAGRLYW